MDDDLRNSLWNCVDRFMFDGHEVLQMYVSRPDAYLSTLLMMIWKNLFKKPVDTIPIYFEDSKKYIRQYFFKADYLEVYDFLDFLASHLDKIDKIEFTDSCNTVLQNELSGYRFNSSNLCPITNSNELKELSDAIRSARKLPQDGVFQHLGASLQFLSDRKNPDYRNSIKESISAVEALAKIICGNPKATLGEALAAIETKIDVHPALKKGFSAIYGYTSDEGGIRHSMLESSKCDFEDAKYMLVSCSAFVNYLIEKSRKAGIKLH